MSGISSTGSSTSSADSTVYGTDVAPVTFPGIASGINYNAIIDKYTNLTLEQEKPLQTQVTSLNAQQAELIKIQNLVTDFQDTFQALSNPALFTATTPSSTNTSAVGATSISGQVATPGAYTIDSATLATATQIAGDPAAGGTVDATTPLASAGTSISPQNGTAGSGGNEGQITIDGVEVDYDVNSSTLQGVVAALNTALQTVDPTGSVTYNAATQKVTITSSQPLTLGSSSDSGNLLSVLKLDTAQITDVAGTYSTSSSAAIGGINLGATFDTDQNAGFATAVTGGTFSINGVKFSVDASGQNLNDIINEINQSSAGVIATYDQTSSQLVLTAKADGPQGISLGATGDSSNFLQAVGLLANYTTPNQFSAGTQETVGKSAQVVYTDASGNIDTVYSNSNTVTNVVPGVQLSLQQDVGGSSGIAPVTIDVAQSSTALQSAIGTFVDAYNKVISEINTATAPPVVGSQSDDATGSTEGTQLTKGGVLFNSQDIDGLKDQLVNFVSGLFDTGSDGYNSLASIGLELDSSFSVGVATSGSSDSDAATNNSDATSVGTQQYDGTSGKLVALDATTLETALAADPNAVSSLFTGANGVLDQLGSYLTSVTGLPTQLNSSVIGTVPPQSLFQTVQAENQDVIQSLQEQITSVTNQANMQANLLRREFVDSEVQIAQLQSMQSSLSSLLAGTSSTS
ncbi:MAG: flagellar filament capping protein FliD [Vulcanimicrobiaceae bacterium]|jgi:flagellar hook-associated protein 2